MRLLHIDSYGIYDNISCDEVNGTWITYLDDFNIIDISYINQTQTGTIEIEIESTCELYNLVRIIAMKNANECDDDQSCVWNTYKLVYNESGINSPTNFYQNHFTFEVNDNPQYQYWTIDPNKIISTDAIDGIVYSILNIESGSFNSSEWIQTDSYSGTFEPIISINDRMAKIKPWNCQIIFTNGTHQTENIFIYSSPPLNYQVLDETDQDIIKY